LLKDETNDKKKLKKYTIERKKDDLRFSGMLYKIVSNNENRILIFKILEAKYSTISSC
jgi:hypothetical protein